MDHTFKLTGRFRQQIVKAFLFGSFRKGSRG